MCLAGYFIETIQKVCDDISCKLFEDFVSKRNLLLFVKQSKQQVLVQPSQKDKSGPLDPRKIDLYLEEIAVMYSRFELYHNFVNSLVEVSSE